MIGYDCPYEVIEASTNSTAKAGDEVTVNPHPFQPDITSPQHGRLAGFSTPKGYAVVRVGNSWKLFHPEAVEPA